MAHQEGAALLPWKMWECATLKRRVMCRELQLLTFVSYSLA